MKRFLNFFIVIIIGALLGIGALVLTRLFTPKPPLEPEELKREVIEEEKPSLLKQQPSTEAPSIEKPLERKETFEETLKPEIREKIKSVFDSEINGFWINYPKLRALFLKDNRIKEYDFQEKTYFELFTDSNLNFVQFSPNASKAIVKFKTDPRYFVIDFKQDRMSPLPPFVETFVFLNEDKILMHQFVKQTISRLILWQNFETKDLKTLGILNPELVRLDENRVLIYEKPISNIKTPVFLYDLRNPNLLKLVLEPKFSYSILASKDGKYIFVNYQKELGEFESVIYDSNFKEKIRFSWGTLKEKCTFEKFLVCGVPKNVITMTTWYQYEDSSQDRIIIYDPLTQDYKEIFDPDMDVIQPVLTDVGLFFLNRISYKLLFIDKKDLSF
jgi:hypothetical protein